MILLLHILLLAILVFRLKLLQPRQTHPWLIPGIIIIKTIAGFALARFYLSNYGGGDIQGYLADVKVFNDFFRSDPVRFFRVIIGTYDDQDPVIHIFLSKLKIWFDSGYNIQYNDARTVIRLHALLSIFSGNNEWVHLIWTNVLSVAGGLALMRFFYRSSQGGKIPTVAYLFFFLPNVFIWTSAILKEPLLLFSMGMTLRYFQLWNNRRTVTYLLPLLLFLFSFMLIKSFWLLAFIPGLLLWLINAEVKKPWIVFPTVYFIAMMMVFMAGMLNPVFDMPAILFGQQLNMWRFAVFMHSGSLIQPVSFAPTIVSFLKHIPDAFIFGLMHPWPWELAKWYYFPMFLENMVVPVLCIFCCRKFLSEKTNLTAEVMIGLCAGVIIVTVCGFTTPVIGSLVRYRMPGMLLLGLALLSGLYDESKEKGVPELKN